jgi:hypothetical protein
VILVPTTPLLHSPRVRPSRKQRRSATRSLYFDATMRGRALGSCCIWNLRLTQRPKLFRQRLCFCGSRSPPRGLSTSGVSLPRGQPTKPVLGQVSTADSRRETTPSAQSSAFHLEPFTGSRLRFDIALVSRHGYRGSAASAPRCDAGRRHCISSANSCRLKFHLGN